MEKPSRRELIDYNLVSLTDSCDTFLRGEPLTDYQRTTLLEKFKELSVIMKAFGVVGADIVDRRISFLKNLNY